MSADATATDQRAAGWLVQHLAALITALGLGPWLLDRRNQLETVPDN